MFADEIHMVDDSIPFFYLFLLWNQVVSSLDHLKSHMFIHFCSWLIVKWRFPKSWGYPQSSSISRWDFPWNQPFISKYLVPPFFQVWGRYPRRWRPRRGKTSATRRPSMARLRPARGVRPCSRCRRWPLPFRPGRRGARGARGAHGAPGCHGDLHQIPAEPTVCYMEMGWNWMKLVHLEFIYLAKMIFYSYVSLLGDNQWIGKSCC